MARGACSVCRCGGYEGEWMEDPDGVMRVKSGTWCACGHKAEDHGPGIVETGLRSLWKFMTT